MDGVEVEKRVDRPPYVKFVRVAVEDREASLKSGTYKTKDEDFAHVTPIGSKEVVHRKVADWFVMLRQQVKEGRWPAEWLDKLEIGYEKWKAGETIPLEGTSIRGWPVLSPAQQQAVIAASILTVEDLAQANGEARQRIGLGAQELVQRASNWLRSAKELGQVTQEISALKIENEQYRHQISVMETQINELKALIPPQVKAA